MAVWTCQRQTGGQRCGHQNQAHSRKCQKCEKSRPKRKTIRSQIKLSYEEFIELNGGEHCGICGRSRDPERRRLHRDHAHDTGRPRGLLCYRCNRFLPTWATVEWLKKAIAYLERSA